MMLKLYNSLTKKKEVFKPRKGKRVQMFVCGITPYDSPHIGNFRVFIVYDMMARYLRHKGYDVFYLQNVTDIDDKIIAVAQKADVGWKKIADKYFAEFLDVCKKLNIKSVNTYAKATDSMKEIIRQIETLIKKGYAYEQNGSVYFEVKKFKNYGKLSGQNLAKLHTSERLQEDVNKKHPYDFVLWKGRAKSLGRATSKCEPSWKSPWGDGRPGWHIEDTAISERYFGSQYDIHGGAVELKFPHHEAEIAQQESASGKKPMVKYWVHSGILMINGEKMSKSLGNFISGKEMLSRHSPDDFRFMILSAHYRSPIDYSEKLIIQARAALSSLREFAQELKKIKSKTGAVFSTASYAKKFFARMDDDFNTPSGIAIIFTLLRDARATGALSTLSARSVIAFLKATEEIFGVSFTKMQKCIIPQHVKELARKRKELRTAGKWTEADMIRDQIDQEGYAIKDTGKGYEITKREVQNPKPQYSIAVSF